jgi:hypothetical protein
MRKGRSTTFVKTALSVVAVTLLSAHVAPSVDDNNRYLKVTPQADGIRLAYTVFFGEIPGASERKLIDANHDGRIDDTESSAYGKKLAAQVASALDLELDGKTVPVTWQVVDVGMGSPQVAAGSFSVDMIAYLCGTGATTHTLQLRDQFRVPRPGETDVKVEDSPGITVTKARIGPADDPTHEYRFVGPGGPLTDDGLVVELTASPSAPRIPADQCKAGAASTTTARRGTSWPRIGIMVGMLVMFAAAVVVALKRRQR